MPRNGPSPAASIRAMASGMASTITAMAKAVAWIIRSGDTASATWPGQNSRSPRWIVSVSGKASRCRSLSPGQAMPQACSAACWQ